MGEITFKRGNDTAKLREDAYTGMVTLIVCGDSRMVKHYDEKEDAIAWLRERNFCHYNRFTKNWQLA